VGNQGRITPSPGPKPSITVTEPAAGGIKHDSSRPGDYRRVMGSALASLLGLIFTAIALYGFYWVIRLAVRDGMLEADRRRQRQVSVPED
jgi:hypothetical protein